VLVNLAVALLLVNVTFLAGVTRTSDYISCIVVAAFLHFFLLAAFSWMLVEGVLQYLRFVKVLDTYIEHFILKVTIPGWGKYSSSALNHFTVPTFQFFHFVLSSS
jgi:hypothetical protein